MDEHRDPEAVVQEFLARQSAMYAGGDLGSVEELLAEDVVWHVPGMSPIAGSHRGREAVTRYFRDRRELAGGAMRVVQRASAHHDEALVQLADGRAVLGGVDAGWRTAGVYRVRAGMIAEAWLVPLDHEQFDDAWGRARPAPFIYSQRVRPQDCTVSGSLGHPRFLEFFEAAFIECWRDRYGSLADSLGADRWLTLASLSVRYLAAVRCDDELRVATTIDRLGRSSAQVHHDAFVADTHIAEALCRYVCVDAQTGTRAALPPSIAAE